MEILNYNYTLEWENKETLSLSYYQLYQKKIILLSLMINKGEYLRIVISYVHINSYDLNSTVNFYKFKSLTCIEKIL